MTGEATTKKRCDHLEKLSNRQVWRNFYLSWPDLTCYLYCLSERPTDNPALHNGRTRTSPHVDGQWFTHLYLELEAVLDLRHTLKSIVKHAQGSLPGRTVHSQVDASEKDGLHLSLSKPLQLWTGQRAPFISSIRKVLRERSSLALNLAALDYLQNEDKTRTFLVCEVGFGYDQLADLTTALNEVLSKDHLPTYYSEARFHVSLAWWLSDPDRPDPDKAVLDELEEKFGKDIRKHQICVDQLHVKIRNDVTVLSLGK